MQILNFNRISIKNRGLDVTFPFTTFARANFPNTRIFLFTLKRFAPKIFKTLLQECSKRILVPSFFRNSIGRFYYYLYKKGVRREIACAPCTGRKKVHNAYFSSLPLPLPENDRKLEIAIRERGKTRGRGGISSKRHQPLRDLISVFRR